MAVKLGKGPSPSLQPLPSAPPPCLGRFCGFRFDLAVLELDKFAALFGRTQRNELAAISVVVVVMKESGKTNALLRQTLAARVTSESASHYAARTLPQDCTFDGCECESAPLQFHTSRGGTECEADDENMAIRLFRRSSRRKHPCGGQASDFHLEPSRITTEAGNVKGARLAVKDPSL